MPTESLRIVQDASLATSDDMLAKALGIALGQPVDLAVLKKPAPSRRHTLSMSQNIRTVAPQHCTSGEAFAGLPVVQVDKAGGSGADGQVLFFEEALVNGQVKKNIRLVVDLGKVIHLSIEGVSLPVQKLTAMKLKFDDRKPKSPSPGVKQMSLGMVGQVPGVWTKCLPASTALDLPVLTFSIKPPSPPVGVGLARPWPPTSRCFNHSWAGQCRPWEPGCQSLRQVCQIQRYLPKISIPRWTTRFPQIPQLGR
jgi:hypothetical protein